MARRLPILLAAALLVAMPACMKSTMKSAINADNTGSLSVKMSYKVEAIENLKAMAATMGEGSEGEVDDVMKELESSFDEKQLTQKMKEQGLEVTSSKGFETDGWKGVELEAAIKDVNAWIEKSSKIVEKKDDNSPLSKMKLPGGGASFAPRFYKTATEGVGEVQVTPPIDQDMMGDMGGMNLDELDDDTRGMIEAQMDNMKAQFSVDEFVMEITMKLPGKIVATKGCKKVDDNTVGFTMKGSEFTLDGMKTMFGMKDGISATFSIPEDCKITFQERKSAVKTEKPDDEAPGEKKEKKGGLKIGEKKEGG